MSRSAVMDLDRVGKVYQLGEMEVVAVHDLSLTIDEGEFVAITGPSGSGKSTLMHILGCLDVPTSGVYRLAGHDVSSFDENLLADVRNLFIGFVFQQFNLLAYLDGVAQRRAAARLRRGAPGRASRPRARRRSPGSGLADRAHHRPGEMSGGQQQRVAIARALVTEPAVILADEPTGNLDSTSTADVLELLGALNEEGSTIVLITHEHDIAARAERRIEMRDGGLGAPPDAMTSRRHRLDASVTWRDTLRTATEAVRTHRLRSALTTLGILIGITAVVLTVGIGNGAKAKVQDQINELGTNILVVSPGSSTSTTGTRGGFGSASTLTQQDADALAAPRHRSRRAVGGADVDHIGVARGRLDQLDHHPDRDHAELVGGALTRRHLGPVPLRRRPDERLGRWWSSAPTPRRSCSGRPTRSVRRWRTTECASR